MQLGERGIALSPDWESAHIWVGSRHRVKNASVMRWKDKTSHITDTWGLVHSGTVGAHSMCTQEYRCSYSKCYGTLCSYSLIILPLKLLERHIISSLLLLLLLSLTTLGWQAWICTLFLHSTVSYIRLYLMYILNCWWQYRSGCWHHNKLRIWLILTRFTLS